VPNAAADLKAIQLWQVTVEQNDVGVLSFPPLECLGAVNGGEDRVAFTAQP